MHLTTATHPLTVVVADDEEPVRRVIERILERDGCDVRSAKNGKEAITLLRASPTDVLVTDLSMPDHEGFETILEIHREQPRLRIVVITGRFQQTPRVLDTATLLGADVVLTKPFTAEQLMTAVRCGVKVKECVNACQAAVCRFVAAPA